MEELALVEDEGSNLRGIQAAVEFAEQGQREHRDQALRWCKVLGLLSSGNATPDELKRLVELTLAATRLIQKDWPSPGVASLLATCGVEDICGEDSTALRSFIVTHVYAANRYKAKANNATGIKEISQ